MKYLKILILIILLSSCDEMGEPKENVQKGDFNLQLLFEHDSCKVYRFQDGSRYIYWSNCQGKIQNDYETGSGKHKRYHKGETTTSTKY